MEKKVIETAKKLFGEGINENSQIGFNEKWDSLGQINLFMALEKEFGVKFDYEEITSNTSIKDIINLLKNKL
jgi:acyl carrier protein